MKAQFVNLQAAADYMGPGAIEIDRYQTEITDIVRRRGAFGQRIKQVPATGHPSRFFEETGIPSPTAANGFVDPRSITPTLVTPTRVERSVPLKCLVSQINYNVFDMEVGAQQSQFAYMQAKDLADSVEGLLRTHDVALWNGNDTSLSSPTTPQYYGAAGQINDGGNVTTIHTTDSIVDGLKSTIAQMVANTNYEVRPTAIYSNPVLLDLIDREMKQEFNVVLSTTEVAGRFARQDALHSGWRHSAHTGMVVRLHRRSRQWLGGPAVLHRQRRHDRVSLAHRPQSTSVSAWNADLAGHAKRGGEVWRHRRQGRQLCPLQGNRGSLAAIFGTRRHRRTQRPSCSSIPVALIRCSVSIAVCVKSAPRGRIVPSPSADALYSTAVASLIVSAFHLPGVVTKERHELFV